VDEALMALGLTFGEVFVLPTAKHKFGLTKDRTKAKKRYGAKVFERIRDLLGRAQELDLVIPGNEMQLLAEVEGIDTGEVVLFAAAACMRHALLATGDKRSLRALASTPSCRSVALRIAGRVICFEQIIRKAIDHCGFPKVRDKVAPARDCDTGLRAIFGSGIESTETNVLAGLDAYIAELRSLPVELLAP
jgi:hypothetical protein